MSLILEGIAYLTITSDWVPLFPYQGSNDVSGPPDDSRGGGWGGQRSLGYELLFPEFPSLVRGRVARKCWMQGSENDGETPDVS